jgi:leucyl aminopeptidase (aminopeptidase T)
MFLSSLAMSAVSAGANYMMQNEQANAQASYQARMAEESNRAAIANANAANKNYIEQATAANMQQMQKQDQTAKEMQDLQIERLQKAGTAMASSESAGVSFENLMADFYRQEARYRDAMRQNLEMDAVQNDIAVSGFRREAKNRGSSFQRYIPSPVSQPSLIGAGLSIGASALDNYNRYYGKK